MTTEELKKNISKAVLEKIKTGQVKMRPKIHFILKTALITLGAIVAALFLLYIISFIAFALRVSGIIFTPGIGYRGFGPFLFALPWLLISVALALVLILEFLVRKFSFAYRKPILYSLLVIFFVVMLGSFVVAQTDFHSRFLDQAERNELPLMGGFYKDYGNPKHGNINIGVIYEKVDNGFNMETRRGEDLSVMFSPDTSFVSDDDIKENDTVVVVGYKKDNIIQAVGVREVDDDFQMMHMIREAKFIHH